MKKNVRACAELLNVSEAQCLVDMNRYELIEGSGMTPDLKHKKNAHMTAGWHFGARTEVRIPLGQTDLDGFRYLTVSVFAVNGEGGSFRLLMESGNEGGGYECTLPLIRNGWNDYRIELPFLQATGEPNGWEHISALCMDCVGGGQFNSTDTVLYFDNFYVYEEYAAPLYATMPELKGAAVFSRTGGFSLIDRKRIPNAIDGTAVAPFEKDGALWLPMAPVAAGIAHAAVADNRAMTLSFTYRRKKYAFSAERNCMTVNGEEEPLGFYPIEQGGTLFFPASFVQSFFHWRQIFTDPMGLIVLSNRKGVFDSARDAELIWQLLADMSFVRPTGTQVLNDLHRCFPNSSRGRLFASFETLMQLRRNAKNDGTLKNYVEAMKLRCGVRSESFCAASCVSGESSAAELTALADRLIDWAMLYRVTGDKAYAERAATEVEALAGLENWAVGSFATAGTLALAVSIVYDWCHHVWSEGRKAIAERALLRNVMRPALGYYDGRAEMWRSGSTVAATVNAGVIATALALADIYPETANKLLDRALRNAEPCMKPFAPDGGFAESTEAWEKSARAMLLTVAMLQTACGTDYGFSTLPGFAATAYFPIFAEGSCGSWNYHNAEQRQIDTRMAYAFSAIFDDPIPAWIRHRDILNGKREVQAFDLLFYRSQEDVDAPRLPLDTVYRKAGLALMRSDWGACSSLVGLHGGRNNEVNGDLDAGSVLLEMGGERFFVDTGKEEALPIALRRCAAGQNTVVIDPPTDAVADQNPDAKASFLAMRSVADRAFAILDLTSVSDALKSAKRGVLLTDSRRVAVIQDEMRFLRPAKLVWSVWTRADVALNKSGRVAQLTQNGKTLACRLCGVGSPAKFSVETFDQTSLKRLSVAVDAKEQLRLAVVCRLLEEGDSAAERVYDVVPMSRWEI